jgi:arylsulfatase A-like enzyme
METASAVSFVKKYYFLRLERIMPTHASQSVIKNAPAHRCFDFWLSLAIVTLPLILKGFIALTSDSRPTKVLPSVLASIGDTPRLLAAILVFALTMLMVHGLFAFLAWRLWRPIAQSINYPASQRNLLGLLFFTILQGGVLALNSLLFPNSALQVATPLFLILLGSGSLAVVLIWHGKCWLESFNLRPWHPGYIAISLASLLLAGFLVNSQAEYNGFVKRDKPDIIIIGLDSFRPDHLKQPGDTVSITPNLDAFLAESYRFERAYTPMARTYPAWMSILTGRYPIEHGARENLLDPKYLKDGERSLPFLLKAQGYTTVYSIDETRFSNIDKRYGFDITVTPEIGAADFLLSSAADLPLSNILNLAPRLHAVLFPYQFMNRAVHKTYEPANFDDELTNLVSSADQQKPLFLVTHFELPHWPFDWRESTNYIAPENPRLAALSPSTYQKAVHRADLQFASLIEVLKRNGRLDNAVVVVLSDHGEGFSEFANKWETGSQGALIDLPPFKGHGLSVMDEAQIHVLLAFKRFGKEISKGADQRLTSLIDIAPTTLQLAGFDKNEIKASGCDLFDNHNKPNCSEDRVLFTESGFYVPSMLSDEPFDQQKIAEEAQAYYDVNPDTRLTFKTDYLPQLLKDKQRAAISKNWIAASVPQYGQKQFVLGNLEKHVFWNMQDKSNYNQPKDKKQLFVQLCQKYANDDQMLDEFCAAL